MDEQFNALSILKMSMIGGKQAEDFPEMLVIDALALAETSPRAARHVLGSLRGLRSPALKSKALLFVGDSDPEVRSEAVEALAVFADEDGTVQALLQQIAQSDPDHEVVSEALEALNEKN